MSGKSTDSIQDSDGVNGIVAELYALRAGLSTVSQHFDRLIEFSEMLEYEEKKVKAIDRQLAENSKTIRKKEEELKTKEERLAEYESKPHKTHISGEVEKAYAITIVCSIFSIMCFAAFFIILLAIGLDESTFGFVLDCICLVVFTCVAIFYGHIVVKSKKETKEAEKNTLLHLKTERDKCAAEVDELRKQGEQLAAKRPQIKAQSEADQMTLTKNEIAPTVYEAKIFAKALEENFSKLLNPTDWQNVDLCIYYLQTGRADTIRECLLLADRQRQNDEIVGAIRQASESIGAEIRGGLAALGKTMVTCINALSAQMEVAFNRFAEQQRQNTEALQSMQALGEDILSAQQLNNALAAKAQVTSEQLMRDYKFVQNYVGIPV